MNLITYDDIAKIECRIGTIVRVEPNEKARKAAYTIEVDFGSLGKKTSSAQVTEHYTAESLLGRQVVAVVNFPVKIIAGVHSEILILGVACEQGTVLLAPSQKVENGLKVF